VEQARILVKNFAFKKHTLSGTEIADMWDSIQKFDAESGDVTESYEKKRTPGFFFRIAASVLLLVAALFTYKKWGNQGYLDYHTAYGETKTIILPDSSTVILNSNSTLKFPHRWSENDTRELWLEGEAYFSVVHKVNNQLFKVYTEEGMAVEVLGTTFNVYHRTEETKVVLNTGKIRLHLPSQSAADNIVMKPGEFVEYKQKSFSKRVVNPAIYTAWTEKKLVLDHTSLREMVDMLHNNYGVDVIVSSDTLLNQTVSGSMPISDVESLVSQIAQTFQLKVDKKKNKYLMHE
jgi:transmembrane sensor